MISPQYLVWLLGLAAVCLTSRYTSQRPVAWLLLAAAAVSGLDYPVLYAEVVHCTWTGVAVMVVATVCWPRRRSCPSYGCGARPARPGFRCRPLLSPVHCPSGNSCALTGVQLTNFDRPSDHPTTRGTAAHDLADHRRRRLHRAHVVRAMTEAGERTVVYDDLSTGIAERVRTAYRWWSARPWTAAGGACPAGPRGDGVIHLAAKKQVGDRWSAPCTTTRENVEGLHVLLDAVTAARVASFVFYVLGGGLRHAVRRAGSGTLVTRTRPCAPMQPVRRDEAGGRVAGPRDGPGRRVSRPPPSATSTWRARRPRSWPTWASLNIVPMIFERLTAHEPPRVFGDDRPPDGTCVRDSFHVMDLAEAHVATARALEAPGPRTSPSTSAGEGDSVRELIDRVNDVTGHSLPTGRGPAPPGRPGESGRLGRPHRHRTGLEGETRRPGHVAPPAWEGWVRLHPEAGTAPGR